jgi:hypothetical protein
VTLADLKNSGIRQLAILTLSLFAAPDLILSQARQNAQPGVSLFEKEVVLSADSSKLSYSLSDSLLIPNSEIVWADSLLLQRQRDYTLNYLQGILVLTKPLPTHTRFKIQYQKFPFALKQNYLHREVVQAPATPDTSANHSQVSPIKSPQPKSAPAGGFASDLRKSGSLTRGITVGSNQGLQVDSGLRMQISGRLTEKVEVVASLTDQNTPIQPEGNTQTLQEIDKVFVQIKAPNTQATLGDYNLSFDGTEFTRYSRKLQGAMAHAEFQNFAVTLSGAVSRGRFATKEFLGQEGNQGPYQLRGSEGQINIIVLAGTERVWVDGELMTRGENNDYVIEYGNGQITFTRRRLITADSRITVDFQFSDESFQRNLWGARGESKLLSDKIKFQTTFIRESDDKDDPLSRPLTDEFIAALAAAGDSLAVVPGFTFVGKDSGNYILDSTGVFVFTGTNKGDYNVSFSFFGENNGDYRNIGLGRFEFVGKNRGSYRPFIILPQARRQDLVGFNLEVSPSSAFNLKSEFAFSQFDRNLFSSRDDGDNQGAAFSIHFNVQPERISLGGHNLGRFQLSSQLRRKNANFQDIDRTTQVEFNRRWNIVQTLSPEESIFEVKSAYLPVDGLVFQGGFGRLSKSRLFESNRWEAEAGLQKKNLPSLKYFIEFIDRDDRNLSQKSTWLRHRGRAEFDLKKLKPMFDYEGEIRKDAQSDTSRTGFRFDSYTAGLEFSPWKSMTASARYNYRDDQDRLAGNFLPKSAAKTQTYSWALNNWHAISAAATYTHRTRDFADAATADTRTDLADFRLGYAPGSGGVRSNLYYQISNTQVARQEEVFIKVEEGQGNFRFNPNLNEFEPDPFGDFIRQVIATNDFIPVVELRFRTDLRLAPARFFKTETGKSVRNGLFQRMLSPVTTETFLRIDERTTEQDVAKIYLLNLSYFQRDSTTIFGSIELRQDVHLWENSRQFALRYRYRNRTEKNNQFIDGGQDRRVREQGVRLLRQFSNHFSVQLEFIHSEEDRLFRSSGVDRKVRSNDLEVDLVYRPQTRIELGMKNQLGFSKDLVADPVAKTSLISFKPRMNYSLSKTGRLRGEIEWTKVQILAAPANYQIPFELNDGNRAGTTLRWNFGFDYRVSRNVQASLSYFGRSEPDRPQAQHFAKVEMRAFF